MQATHNEVRREVLNLSAIVDAPREIALDRLQNAILQLASKPSARPTGFGRQKLGSLVDQALEAYRQYMMLGEPAAKR